MSEGGYYAEKAPEPSRLYSAKEIFRKEGPRQLELPLITTQELESRLRDDIERYRRIMEMCHEDALKWRQLLSAIDRNPTCKKLWENLLLLSRLSDSNE